MEEDLIKSKLNPGPSFTKNGRFNIIVVRHAQSLANANGFYQGQTFDTDLSELGRKQAKALAKKLQEFNIDKIVSSPLKRTYQTALEIAKLINCKIETDERLLEINHGVWEGKSKEWIMENDRKLFEIWHKTPHKIKFTKNRETLADITKRTKSFMENYPFTENTLVVTHDCIIRTIISVIAENKIEKFWNYLLDNASINIFEVGRANNLKEIKPILLNELGHLKNINV